MSAFHGKQSKGARKRLREVKRVEAEERNRQTRPERRREYRLLRALEGEQ